MAEIDLVEIGLEDRRLLVARLHEQGHRGFLELAFEAALGRQEEILDELLGECAASLTDLARDEVRLRRPEHAPEIYAGMRLEALARAEEIMGTQA